MTTNEALRLALDLLARCADAAPASMPANFDSVYDSVLEALDHAL